MGGAPAVRFGVIGNANLSISVSGQRWNDISRLADKSVETPPFDQICACLPQCDRNIVYIHSAAHKKDQEQANAMATLTGGKIMPVQETSGHHVIGELWINNQLPAFLDAIFKA